MAWIQLSDKELHDILNLGLGNYYSPTKIDTDDYQVTDFQKEDENNGNEECRWAVKVTPIPDSEKPKKEPK